jgi:hypothetical protein
MPEFTDFVVQAGKGYGFITREVAPLTEKFVDAVWASEKAQPGGRYLDIGAGLGLASFGVLEADTGIAFVNDVQERLLRDFRESALESGYEAEQFQLVPGRFPAELTFEKSSLRKVHSCNVFHFLKPDEIHQGLQNLYDWLEPEGEIFIMTMSPYVKLFIRAAMHFPGIEEKGIPWRQGIEKDAIPNELIGDISPDMIEDIINLLGQPLSFLCEDMLNELCHLHNFKVLESGSYTPSFTPDFFLPPEGYYTNSWVVARKKDPRPAP